MVIFKISWGKWALNLRRSNVKFNETEVIDIVTLFMITITCRNTVTSAYWIYCFAYLKGVIVNMKYVLNI